MELMPFLSLYSMCACELVVEIVVLSKLLNAVRLLMMSSKCSFIKLGVLL